MDVKRLDTDPDYREFYLIALEEAHDENFDFDFHYRCECENYSNKDQALYKLANGEELYIVDSGRGLTNKEANEKIEDWLKLHPDCPGTTTGQTKSDPDQRTFLENAKLWHQGIHFPELLMKKLSPETVQIKINLHPNFIGGQKKEVFADYSLKLAREFLEYFLDQDSSYVAGGENWGM